LVLYHKCTNYLDNINNFKAYYSFCPDQQLNALIINKLTLTGEE